VIQFDLSRNIDSAAQDVQSAISVAGAVLRIADGGSGAAAAAAAAAGAVPTAFSYGGSSWLAGGQGGCNYQAANWVFGIETDMSGTELNGTEAIATNVLGMPHCFMVALPARHPTGHVERPHAVGAHGRGSLGRQLGIVVVCSCR
jgi:hypothetical protein